MLLRLRTGSEDTPGHNKLVIFYIAIVVIVVISTVSIYTICELAAGRVIYRSGI